MAVELQGLAWAEAWHLFDYNAETGVFTRLVKRGPRMPGAKVGTLDGKGYLHVYYEGVFIRLHRLAWFMYLGWLPDKEIDHINNDKTDNRICNLRDVNKRQNAGNIHPPRHNTSGLKGAYFHSTKGHWQAQIKINGRQTGLGVTDNKFVAAAWYNYAAKEHFGACAKLNEIPGYGFLCLKPKTESRLP